MADGIHCRLFLVVIATATAQADEAPSSQTSTSSLQLYTDTEIGVGSVQLVAGRSRWIGRAREAVGVELGRGGGPHLRIGGVLEAFRIGGTASDDRANRPVAIGIEVHADWPASDGWRLGARLSGLRGASFPLEQHTLATAGFRARRGMLTLDADVIVPLDNPDGTGVAVGAGVTGWPAAAIIIVTVLGGAVAYAVGSATS